MTGLIVSMRLVLILLLILSSSLYAGDAYASAERREIGAGNFRISLTRMRVYLDLGVFSAGELDRTGLVRTLSHPHEKQQSLTLECTPFRSDGDHAGAAVALGPFRAGISLNGRPAAAVSLSYENFSAAVLYAGKGGAENDLVPVWAESLSFPVLYGAVSARLGAFSLLFAGSAADDLGMEGFVSLSAGTDSAAVTVSAGRLFPLYSDSDDYLYSVHGMLKRKQFSTEFSFRIGSAPVFSDDYLPYEAEIRSSLELSSITVHSSMEYSFSRTGRSLKKDRFTISHDLFELGYDSSCGVVAVFRAGPVEAGYDEGRFFVALEKRAVTEHASILLRLSSDSLISVSAAVDL